MQDVIIIQLRPTYQNQELTTVIHLGPLVSTILDHYIIKRTSNRCFMLLRMIKQKCSSVMFLYTYATMRGIILDLVKDGYTKTFINSLRTFIARRRCPKNVISDNGKVFTADEIQPFCSNKGISWGLNLAKAPWQ